MCTDIDLKYGTTRIGVPLPAGTTVLTIREPEKRVSESRFFADLNTFLSAKRFGTRSVSVVVADKTRLCAYDRYLPVLVDCLQSNGVNFEAITFLIAYGTHTVQSDVESNKAYGEVYRHHRFVHHDCRNARLFKRVGHTSQGTPVRLRKDILETDLLITLGAISHHYFAGFGGGRKLIFPGLGDLEAIYANHSLFLDKQNRTLSAGCRAGRLAGNPLAEDLAEIETHKPADLAIHGILDSRGDVCQLLVGKGRDHFRNACAFHGENCEREGGAQYELVVASCGGHPKDINFIQAHKAIHNAADFVSDGGMLILFARCPEGLGSKTFLPWFKLGSRGAAFDRLLDAYQGNGGTALALMEKTERIRISLVTELPSDLCKAIGVTKLAAERVDEQVLRHKGTLAIIPNASLLVRGGRS